MWTSPDSNQLIKSHGWCSAKNILDIYGQLRTICFPNMSHHYGDHFQYFFKKFNDSIYYNFLNFLTFQTYFSFYLFWHQKIFLEKIWFQKHEIKCNLYIFLSSSKYFVNLTLESCGPPFDDRQPLVEGHVKYEKIKNNVHGSETAKLFLTLNF